MNLKQDGIDISLVIAGTFGSLMTMSSKAGLNIGRSILCIVGGAASANYITPLLLHIAHLDDDSVHYSYSVAFLLGFAGLRAVETISKKLISENEPVNNRKRSR